MIYIKVLECHFNVTTHDTKNDPFDAKILLCLISFSVTKNSTVLSLQIPFCNFFNSVIKVLNVLGCFLTNFLKYFVLHCKKIPQRFKCLKLNILSTHSIF